MADEAEIRERAQRGYEKAYREKIATGDKPAWDDAEEWVREVWLQQARPRLT